MEERKTERTGGGGGKGGRQRRHSEQYVRKREQNRGREKDLKKAQKGTEKGEDEEDMKTGRSLF